MYNWNILKEYKATEALFYEYFKWQKYDSYLNLFYSSEKDILDGESLSFDEVVEFFEHHKILLNVTSFCNFDITYDASIINIMTSVRTFKHNFSEREDAQIFAIDVAINELEKNLTSNNVKIKFKNEQNIENNVVEFFK